MRKKWIPVAAALAVGLVSGSANAALEPFQSFVGNYGVSSDGFGSTGNTGTISAEIPAGSTIVAAYLYSATYSTTGTPTATLNGTAAVYGPRVGNDTACCSLASFRADVTSTVRAAYDGSGGIYDFAYDEGANGSRTDGSALVVVYENASLPTSTVGILDGWASVNGDTTSINFAEALDPTEAGFFAEMRLGINFSCCSQRSTVDVNGQRITENAGNYDDGLQQANGSLFTMGGFDDPFSPDNPSYADDHERYDLRAYIDQGDTTIRVDTANASRDDNIFLALFYVSGEAGINEPPPDVDPPGPRPEPVPEPGTLLMMGLGLIGIGAARRRRRA